MALIASAIQGVVSSNKLAQQLNSANPISYFSLLIKTSRSSFLSAGTASSTMLVDLVSSLIFSSLREAQPRTSGVPPGLSC